MYIRSVDAGVWYLCDCFAFSEDRLRAPFGPAARLAPSSAAGKRGKRLDQREDDRTSTIHSEADEGAKWVIWSTRPSSAAKAENRTSVE